MNFNSALKKHLEQHGFKTDCPAQNFLKKSIFYTLFSKGSRFRPKLCFATARFFHKKASQILPWAITIEMIHSASLIHDDLPCMDNAKKRREKKCNHLIFGEDFALLAGTCLFIESFSLLTKPIFNKKRTELLKLLTFKAGFKGLISGQALDLKKPSKPDIFFKMIKLKTASLIEAAVLGPLTLWGKTKKEKKALKDYALNLGLAYQLKDDLKDKDSILKSKKLKEELKKRQDKCLKALQPFRKRAKSLEALIFFNQKN